MQDYPRYQPFMWIISEMLITFPKVFFSVDYGENVYDRNITVSAFFLDINVYILALLTGYTLGRLLKSTFPALTLFLTPLIVPFLLQMLILLLLNSFSLLALAYNSRSSGSQPFSSWAAPRPFRWLLASPVGCGLPCSAHVLLLCSEPAESESEAHHAVSSLNTSAKTRPLLAAATRNLTVLPAFSFSFFHCDSSIVIHKLLTWFSFLSGKLGMLFFCFQTLVIQLADNIVSL